MNRECAVGNAYGSKHPFPFPHFDPSKPTVEDLPAIAAYFKSSPDVAGTILALGSPSTGVAAWRQVSAVLKQYELNFHDQTTAAAAASDSARFVATFGTAQKIQQTLLAAATNAGIRSAKQCVTYFGS